MSYYLSVQCRGGQGWRNSGEIWSDLSGKIRFYPVKTRFFVPLRGGMSHSEKFLHRGIWTLRGDILPPSPPVPTSAIFESAMLSRWNECGNHNRWFQMQCGCTASNWETLTNLRFGDGKNNNDCQLQAYLKCFNGSANVFQERQNSCKNACLSYFKTINYRSTKDTELSLDGARIDLQVR